MGIDQEKVKRFWDERANSYNNVAFESVVNLELDPENLELKIRLETEKVFDYIPDVADQSILDLGCRSRAVGIPIFGAGRRPGGSGRIFQ